MLLQTQPQVEPRREHRLEASLRNSCARVHLCEFVRAIRATNMLAVISIDERGADVTRSHSDASSPYSGSVVFGRLHDDATPNQFAWGVEGELWTADIDHEQSATFSPGLDIALLRAVLSLDGVSLSEALDMTCGSDATVNPAAASGAFSGCSNLLSIGTGTTKQQFGAIATAMDALVNEGDRAGIRPDAQPVLVGLGVHRHAWVRVLIAQTRAEHPETIVVDMGWPDEAREHADVVTWGASRAMGAALFDWPARRAS